MDELYMKYPFYGQRNLRKNLKDHGYSIGRKRIRRLMRIMGIEALVYLVVIMDWHSRAVLAWEISNTMDSAFCLRAL